VIELLFIRHGETDWNRQQRFQGQIDVPLNATGLQQAARLAQRLAGEQHDQLFSSDLQRARQTAAPLAAAWQMPAVAVAGLREQSFGVLEGLDAPTIQARHPELWRLWLQQDADFAPPGGESQRQFHQRVVSSVNDLAASASGKRLVVVTHGGVLDMLWRSVHGLPLCGLRECAIPNTGVNRLRWAGGALQIEVWGDDAHVVAAD
jgi:2,3-bisphosphoglycerate-dependent phosphoglycerate mutase